MANQFMTKNSSSVITFDVLPSLQGFYSFPKPSVTASVLLLRWMVISVGSHAGYPFFSAISWVVVLYDLVLQEVALARNERKL